MLAWRPHSITVQAPANAGGVVEGVTYGEPATVSGCLRPLKSEAALRDYGLDVQCASTFYCAIEDAALFVLGALVTYGARKFKVLRRARIYESNLMADHAAVVLEEVDHA